VRAYRPEAQAVRVQPAGVEGDAQGSGGPLEALLPKATLPLEYELEIEYANGKTSPCGIHTRSFRRSATSTCISRWKGRHEEL